MKFVLLGNRKVVAVAFASVVLLAAGVAWWQRDTLQAWYALRGLAAATDADREVWADRVAALDEAAVPGLHACLGGGEPKACDNAAVALVKLGERWSTDDPRRGELAGRLAETYPRLPPAGQQAVLQTCAEWLTHGAPPGVVHAASRLPTQAARSAEAGVRTRGLELVAALLEQPDHTERIADCRDLAKACLTDAEAANRMRAAQAAAHPGMGLLEHVVPLLNDPAAEVRREALRAVGLVNSVVATDQVLRLLHDPDADVRLLCETVLRSRGFRGKHLKLARLITDDRPVVRLQVLEYLESDTDLEPGVWLRRLSVDAAPEVRAAAVRAAAENPLVDLSDRLHEMAQGDPSPTVSQLARYYLSSQPRRPAAP